MSITVAIFIGAFIGAVLCYLVLSSTRNSAVIAEYEQKIQALMLAHQQHTQQAIKKSLNTSRATIKGRIAEQFAPMLPEFEYLPSDAKFLGDPVDYVIFDGYTEWRDGNLPAEQIEVILMDIKSGNARLSKGQIAIEQAVNQGRVRFETLHIQTSEDIEYFEEDILEDTLQNTLQDRAVHDKTMQRKQ